VRAITGARSAGGGRRARRYGARLQRRDTRCGAARASLTGMPDELIDVDLRPSPWGIHRALLALLGAGYLAFALAVLTAPHRTALDDALAEAVVIILGGSVAGFAALASVMVALCERRRHPLLTAYAATAAVVALLVAAWTLAP